MIRFNLFSRALLLQVLLLGFCGLLPAVFAQGRIPKAKDGSVKGALVFLPNSELAKGFHSAQSPFPGKTDPVFERNNWVYSDDKKIAVRGFVKDAVLLFQWWTLLGDPIEKYAFKWVTSGYYEVMYEEKGQMVTKTIYRSDLVKYPDLLKKFDNIEPYNVNVQITFSSGNIDDHKYADFRRKYNILTDLGSAGYKNSYTIESLGVHYLFAPSGKDAPFILPTMAVGGWPDFLNVEKKDDERTKRNIELFRLGQEIHIQSFKITDMDWQFGYFSEIARQFERYEKKEDSPKEVAEKAGLTQNSDGGDDFWNHAEVLDMDMEVYRDPTNGKYGLKAKKGLRAIPAVYSDLKATAKKGIFLGRTSNGVVAVNGSGKEIASLSGNWYLGDGYAYSTSSAPKDEDCWDYDVTYYENKYFENGSFSRTTRTASISKRLSLMVLGPGETYTEEDKKRGERRDAACYQKRKSQAISNGYSVKD